MRPCQGKLGLVIALGLMGLLTMAGREGVAQPQPPATLSREDAIAPSDQSLLRPGSRGAAVATLQRQLQRLGYYADSVDGRYGAATAAAVQALQQDHNLTADGIVGPETQQVLADALAAQESIFPVRLSAVTPPTFTRLRVADPQPPPSHLWLVLMPLVPLTGGGLTYWVRRLQAKEPFAPADPPPKQSP